MAERKRSAASRTAIWIVVGLLMFAMVGFGAAGLSGTARSLGTVGDKQVGVQQYFTALTNLVRQTEQQQGRSLSQQDIQLAGLDQQALAGLISQRALDQAATDFGLSVGDEQVREQVLAIPAFSGLTGTFDRAAYAEILRQNNLTESEFETSLREGVARDILAQAVVGDINASPAYAEALVGFIAETRDFAWAEVEQGDLTTGTPVPTDEDLQAYHTDNEALFTTPASKDLTYVWITPDMMIDGIDVDDAEIAALYAERSDEFNTPETRIVDRLIFPDVTSAEAAKAAIDLGGQTFEDAVAQRGLTLADVDFGDVTKTSAGDLADALFAPQSASVVGPIDTDLGPALFRISAILDAQVTPLEDVADDLRAELALDVAEQDINALAEAANDLIASGAALSEVAAETDMTLEQLIWHAGVDAPINAYSEFQAAAAAVTATDFPELLELSDGGYFALEFNGDVPAALQPFDTVRAEVEAAWTRDAVKSELMDQAEALKNQVGDAPLSSLGLITVQESDIARTDFVDGVNPTLVSTAFDMVPGDVRVVDNGRTAIIVQLNAVHDADVSTDANQNLVTLISDTLNQDLAEAIFAGFAQGVQQGLDVNINQQTVNSVTSQLRGGAR